MEYKQLLTADLSSTDKKKNLAEIYYNGQKSIYIIKASATECWVETFIAINGSRCLAYKNGQMMLIRLYGNVEIYALDKKGNKIQEKGE